MIVGVRVSEHFCTSNTHTDIPLASACQASILISDYYSCPKLAENGFAARGKYRRGGCVVVVRDYWRNYVCRLQLVSRDERLRQAVLIGHQDVHMLYRQVN